MLDLVPLPSGRSSAQAVGDMVALAQHAEALGYRRYWLAEHHNMQSLVSSAPEVLIAALSQRTRTLRLGAGGIMLPNHSPLKVAETFRLLEALAPGRIDLGLGRAPGTDMRAALALRRSREALQADDFEAQLTELLAFGGREFAGEHPFRGTAFEGVIAAPYDQPLPPLWMLSSSGPRRFGGRRDRRGAGLRRPHQPGPGSGGAVGPALPGGVPALGAVPGAAGDRGAVGDRGRE